MQDNAVQNEPTEFTRDVWIRRARIAVALALIKTKPRSLTGEEHTRLLAQKIRKWQFTLRSTNVALQDENVRLRQKLTLHELGAADSGFSSDGELPMQVCTSQAGPGGAMDAPLKEHIVFFQSLLSIKSHLRSTGHLLSQDTDGLCQSLACVFRFLTDNKFAISLPSRTIDDAARTVTSLCDRNGLSDVIATSCLEFAEDLLRGMDRVDLDDEEMYKTAVATE